MSTEDSGANWTAYPLFDCNFEIWGTAYTVGDLTITTQMYDTMALAIAAIDTDTHPATTDHHNINILPGGQGMKSISVLKYVRSAT